MSIKQGSRIIAGSGGGIANYDGKSITENTNKEIQTVGVIDSNNTTNAIKTWTGTKAQYDAIATKDSATLYNITDDTDVSMTILEALYPVGSVYITTAATCPLSMLINGSTWIQETCRQLVEKKEPTDSDMSWYNLYSDGWCEQGGRVSISQDTQTTVTLLKAFSNTNYTVLISACRSGIQTSGDGNFTVEYVSESQFKWSNGDDFGGTGIWYACGYTSTTTSYKQFRRTA